MFCPTDFLHSSPYPHYEGLQSFYIFFSHGPCPDPYCMTFHINVLIIRFLTFLSNFPLRSSPLFENASFPMTVLLSISLWHLILVVLLISPRHLAYTSSE